MPTHFASSAAREYLLRSYVRCDAQVSSRGHSSSHHQPYLAWLHSATASHGNLFPRPGVLGPGSCGCGCAMATHFGSNCLLTRFESDLLGLLHSKLSGFASTVRFQSWKAFRPIPPVPHRPRPLPLLAPSPFRVQETTSSSLRPTARMARSPFPTVSNNNSSQRTEMG